MIEITDAAIDRIKKVMAEDIDMKLRIAVQGGGCGGFQYGFSMEEKAEDDDFEFQRDGITVLVDSVSMQYLNDAEIDYEESLMGSQFKIKNPNVTATCGCGSSFAV